MSRSTPITIAYADGPSSPRISPEVVIRHTGLPPGSEREVTLGWTVERLSWIDDPAFRARTLLPGYGLARAVNEGRIKALPVRLSAVPAFITSNPPDIGVVSGVRRGSTFAFAGDVGWADVLAGTARQVVVEVDEDGFDLGGPEIAGNIVATISRPAASGAAPAASRAPDDVDRTIGRLVASLLPDEPTLQFGPGGIGEAIAGAIDRPVRIWSGLVTEAMAELNERGLLLAPIVAAYAWGGDAIRALATAGMLKLTSVTTTHDISRLSATPRFVGCNTAVQLGLDGAVNVERVGGRIIAGVGGHADFCVGASRSIGGMSMVAVRATAAAGSSTIVPAVDVVSTPRSDIDVVVTEHGIADLRGADDAERACRLIEVAAPEHRSYLRQAAEDRRR